MVEKVGFTVAKDDDPASWVHYQFVRSSNLNDATYAIQRIIYKYLHEYQWNEIDKMSAKPYLPECTNIISMFTVTKHLMNLTTMLEIIAFQ